MKKVRNILLLLLTVISFMFITIKPDVVNADTVKYGYWYLSANGDIIDATTTLQRFYYDETSFNLSHSDNISDENIAFDRGVSVYYADNESGVMVFNIHNMLEDINLGYSVYKFDVYSCSFDNLNTDKVYSIIMVMVKTCNNCYIMGSYLLYHDYFYYSTSVGVVDAFRSQMVECSYPYLSNNAINNYSLNGYNDANSWLLSYYSDFKFLDFYKIDDNPYSSCTLPEYTQFYLKVKDMYARYFVKLSYNYYSVSSFGANLNDNNLFENFTCLAMSQSLEYSITSDMVSYYDVVCKLNDNNELGVFDGRTLSTLNKLISEPATKNIRICYLEQIEGTPFAKKVYRTVNLPLSDSYLDPGHVYGILKEKCHVLQSNISHFELKDNVYYAVYPKSIYLSSRTVDGNYINYFMDLNLSFETFYKKFVIDGIFPSEAYQWLFDSIRNRYQILNNYSANEIFGYWGYVAVPYTYTLNQVASELFSTETKFSGVVDYYNYRATLSPSAYNKLLDDYNYTFLQKAWNDIAGILTDGYTADNYFFFVDGIDNKTLISANGSDDINNDSGVVTNKVSETVDMVSDSVEDMLNNINGDMELIRYIVMGLGVVIFLGVLSKIYDFLFRSKKKY